MPTGFGKTDKNDWNLAAPARVNNSHGNAAAGYLYALRQMRLSPVFTLTAMLTLALGIGATTAIFSLIYSVMLKSLPVVDPSTLYRIGAGTDCCVQGGPQDDWGMYSYPLFLRLQAAAPEFEQMAAFQAAGVQFSVRRGQRDNMAKPLRGEFVTGNYFSTFGIRAFAGRTIAPSDDQASAPPVAMLSYRAWQQQYEFRSFGRRIDLHRRAVIPLPSPALHLLASSVKRCAAILPNYGCPCNRNPWSTQKIHY